ncbi:zinc finger MYM-type protein 1-like [Mauremys mutica]|uniref:zinc finger MYM-type protein 1-like n=1 Tax=Mauremys mutica TaxID=74926 RepID=UPI001D16CA53|nr:zinc finger MYM-type protein 1-like [Mauremys mutica]
MDKFLIKLPREKEEKGNSSSDGLSSTPSFETEVIQKKEVANPQDDKKRSFQQSWLSRFKWLEYNIKLNRAFCSVCKNCSEKKILIFSTKAEPTFISSGFQNWKHALRGFTSHEKSSCHKEAVMKYAALQSQVNVSALVSASYRKESQSARIALHNIFTSVQYLAQQGIALRGHNDSDSNLMQLLLLRSTDSEELRQWLNRTKYKWISHEVINEIIEMMAMTALRKIVQKIKASKFYAIVMDETTDLSRKEQVRFSLRFFSSEDWEIYEEFIGFYQTDTMDAASLFKIVEDTLLRCDLPFSDCRGQCYDGASNVSGKFTGVQARVKEREPRAEFVHCAAHSLNLATQDALHNIQECRYMFFMVKDLINAFRESPKRMAAFREFQSEGEPSLRPLCPTRWTLRISSIKSLLQNYKAMMNCLDELSYSSDEFGLKCSGFSKQLQSFSTYFILTVLVKAMGLVEEANAQIQSPNVSLTSVMKKVGLLQEVLSGMRTDSSYNRFWETTVEKARNLYLDEPTLPRKRKPPRWLDHGSLPHTFSDPKDYFHKKYVEIIDACKVAIEQRFSTESFTFAVKLEKLITEAANGSKQDIVQISEAFHGDINMEKLFLHLEMLSDICRLRNCQLTSVSEVKQFLKQNEGLSDLLSEVTILLKLFYTIPTTTCTAERSFSCLRRLKNYLRTTMSQERLNHLTFLHVHKNFTSELDIASLLDDFISRTKQRQKVFAAS